MESSNYTQSFPGISHQEEEQMPTCIPLRSPRNAKASVLVQAHLCLYRMTLLWFQHPSFPVLILILGSLSLHIPFQLRMPISSTNYWLPIQAYPCPTGCSSTETPPLMHLGQHLSFQHCLRPFLQKHFTKQPASNDEATGGEGHPTALLPFCSGSKGACSCLTHSQYQ